MKMTRPTTRMEDDDGTENEALRAKGDGASIE
jgi:hypothetical protein